MKSIKGRGSTAPVHHNLPHTAVWTGFEALSKNRDSIKSLITSLVKQKRIVHDKENGILCDSQESANTPDYGMIASFWVLLDFKKPLYTILTVNFR